MNENFRPLIEITSQIVRFAFMGILLKQPMVMLQKSSDYTKVLSNLLHEKGSRFRAIPEPYMFPGREKPERPRKKKQYPEIRQWVGEYLIWARYPKKGPYADDCSVKVYYYGKGKEKLIARATGLSPWQAEDQVELAKKAIRR